MGGLIEKGGSLQNLTAKGGGGLIREGGSIERGGLIELLRYFKKGCFSDACGLIDRSASCLLNVHVVLKQEQMCIFIIWFSPGMSLARKAIDAFTYSKNGASQSMKQGSCNMYH